MLPETIVVVRQDGSEREYSRESFLNILRSRRVVSDAGRVPDAKCNSRNTYMTKEGTERTICNFDLITDEQDAQMWELVSNGEYQDALNISLSYSVDGGSSRFLPEMGEICQVSLGFVESREGEQVLRIRSCTAAPVVKTKRRSLEELNALLGITSSVEPEPVEEPVAKPAPNKRKEKA